MAAPVTGRSGAFEQAGILKAGEDLGDGGWRHGCTAGQLRADKLALGDSVEREVLGECERGMVACQ